MKLDPNVIILSLTLITTSITSFIIFLQYRYQTKPLLKVEVKDLHEGDKRAQRVLETTDNLGLFVKNVSHNTAMDVEVKYCVKVVGKFFSNTIPLDRLYPEESIKFPTEAIKYVVDKFPELLDEHHLTTTSILLIPKKTLNIVYSVDVTYNKSLFGLFKHKIHDRFEIEWGSLEKYPRLSDHPIQRSYNKRDGLYVFKS